MYYTCLKYTLNKKSYELYYVVGSDYSGESVFFGTRLKTNDTLFRVYAFNASPKVIRREGDWLLIKDGDGAEPEILEEVFIHSIVNV